MIKAKQKTAFTLAEVLLTLAIIGIVAAMTIPSMILDIQGMDTYSKLRKVHTVFQQSVKLYMAHNGVSDLSTSELFQGNIQPTPAWTAFKPYYNLIKDCGEATGQGCFAKNVMYKHLNNSNRWVMDNYANFFAKGILADGMSIAIHDYIGNCIEDASASNTGPLSTTCAAFIVDINGEKGPNQYGRDTFEFLIIRDGTVYATGVLDSAGWGCNPTGGNTSTDGYAGHGYGCANKILKDGKVNY